MVTKPLGFGDAKQTAEFFGLPRREVLRRAQNGEWPSWVISGRRVFDLDQLVERLAKHAVQGQEGPHSDRPRP